MAKIANRCAQIPALVVLEKINANMAVNKGSSMPSKINNNGT